MSHYNIMNPQLPLPWNKGTYEAYFFVRPFVRLISFYSGHFPSKSSWCVTIP